ncbi:MAG: MarR family transcriptional regulator [Fulvimarina manganoxydans]|uniref:MarR family winged helix-turn-helix transcriptional regulator n=1 Tax=Fulvimarina manganoxydans TaxID=937218 RepID=UPI002355C932|nr:MarR family transcriptional regulator [Fulvimarina manganoxydans]MCK5931601.1 MarR family transcriptional regulator [Fulvimarina manganoxydans]
MSDDKHLRLDDQLCFALYAATNAVTRSYAPLLKAIDLTYPQYLVMLVLWQDGPSTSGSIARRLKLAPHSITPLLDKLERAGFVERERDRADRRVVHVLLSERGRALESAAADAQSVVECQTGLDDVTLPALREELMRLVNRMEAEDETQANAVQTPETV